MADLKCVDCGDNLEWGYEYQLPHGDDHNAVCGDCWRDLDEGQR